MGELCSCRLMFLIGFDLWVHSILRHHTRVGNLMACTKRALSLFSGHKEIATASYMLLSAPLPLYIISRRRDAAHQAESWKLLWSSWAFLTIYTSGAANGRCSPAVSLLVLRVPGSCCPVEETAFSAKNLDEILQLRPLNNLKRTSPKPRQPLGIALLAWTFRSKIESKTLASLWSLLQDFLVALGSRFREHCCPRSFAKLGLPQEDGSCSRVE